MPHIYSLFHDSSVKKVIIHDDQNLDIEFCRDDEILIAQFKGVKSAAISDLLNGNTILHFHVYEVNEKNISKLHKFLRSNVIDDYYSSENSISGKKLFVDIVSSYGMIASIACDSVFTSNID